VNGELLRVTMTFGAAVSNKDIDFDEDGRESVLKYVVDKYGHDKVAHIITFGSMAAKMAIRDVARVQRLPLPDADRLVALCGADDRE